LGLVAVGLNCRPAGGVLLRWLRRGDEVEECGHVGRAAARDAEVLALAGPPWRVVEETANQNGLCGFGYRSVVRNSASDADWSLRAPLGPSRARAGEAPRPDGLSYPVTTL